MTPFNLQVELSCDKHLVFSEGAPLSQGENKTTQITVTVPSEYADYNFTLEFDCPRGKRYVSPTLSFEPTLDGKLAAAYPIDNALLAQAGLVTVQLTARSKSDSAVVFKSVKSVKSAFFVNEAVCAVDVDAPYYDYFAQLEEYRVKAEEVRAQIQSLAEGINGAIDKTDGIVCELREAALRGDFDGPAGEKGERGEKGDKGDVGEAPDVSHLLTLNTPQTVVETKTFAATQKFCAGQTVDGRAGIMFANQGADVVSGVNLTLADVNVDYDEQIEIQIPNKSGTFALLSDVESAIASSITVALNTAV
ncbi:MAG: hypothetical protein NC350_01025 [Corallococcus sp.]|nr:hypothetical protein [Corallococcus sp.]